MASNGIQDSSITKKLTRMNLLVSAAALLVACVAFIGYDLFAFREGSVYNLSIQAQVTGANSASALLFNDAASANTTLAALKSAPNIVAATITTADGKPFANYKRAPGDSIVDLPRIGPGGLEWHEFHGGSVILGRRIVFEEKTVGFIYIRSDLSRLISRFERYIAIAALVMLASLIFAFVISSTFRTSIADPIIHLAETARSVSRDKQYSVRATVTDGHDEVATLIAAFNEMLEQIQVRDAALQNAQEELEHRVEERTKELSAANKELEAFSYSVSHDLRAPLRSIDGFSLALLDDYGDKLDDAAKDYLKRVRAATLRMGQLIDDMLNLSRVTRADMVRDKVDLSALANSVVEQLRFVDPQRNVDISIAEGMFVDADARLLRLVVENLLGNAWKYTSNRAQAHIEFDHTQQNGRSVYFIHDDGAGFDQRYAGRLFGVFQRLHGMTEFPGTGVGLATVQRIIHRHGGEVWAEGEVDKGATFYFTL